ncbi:mitochondrial import inner membrane translocase subunit Tim10-like [Mizuhopecten yessoensis]|uniref:Mitochondrial import inner membrane translocase subunit n=1 Tax=Mizuhopecten yessoensis TaxID=6573 RepID=A0A210R7G0_MIZYE|nr:mitochondrial import inner membrane translocase subunit Tim10-like [Mizuhopecten yessoensis]OWF56806.1 Mitochondrial import inner membrane translocase subunit Tim10 [Mizuhopecten yessoensis]
MENFNESQIKLLQELEVEMMQDLYQRASGVCLKKCMPPNDKDTELSKSEAVCIDKCIGKYLEIQEVVNKTLTSLQQEENAKVQAVMQGQAPK